MFMLVTDAFWRETGVTILEATLVADTVHLVDETGGTVVAGEDGFPNMISSPTLFRVSLSGLR